MHLTVLVGGPGGRFVADGLLAVTSPPEPPEPPDGTSGGGATPQGSAVTEVELTFVASTAEDVTLCGLRFCPDLDHLQHAVDGHLRGAADGVDRPRTFETWGHLGRWAAAPDWFRADDETVARAITRSRALGAGLGLSEAAAPTLRSGTAPAPRVLPMSDQPVESHVVVDTGDGEVAVHVAAWAAQDASTRPAPRRLTAPGLSRAHPAPGVLDAVRGADAVVVPFSAPVTGLGVMLGLPGLRDALRGTSAPVIGVSPALLPQRGDEADTLRTLDLDLTATAMRSLFSDVLDGYVLGASDVDATGGPGWPAADATWAVAPGPDAAGVATTIVDLARRMRTS